MSETEQQSRVDVDPAGKVRKFEVPDFQYSKLGMFILYRLLNNRDCKVIITSSGSTTGTGKTTLAVILCRWIRRMANDIFDESKTWTAEEWATVDLGDYFRCYKNSDSGDAILADEIEYSADRRRAMSDDNLKLSHAWSILRYQNVVTVATLPSVSMLDSRLMELGDVWINVTRRGEANPYYLTVNDFSGEIIRHRLHNAGYQEVVKWDPLPEGDPDLAYLDGQKEDIGIPGMDDRVTESDVKDAKRDYRDTVIEEALKMRRAGHIDATLTDIAEVAQCSQGHVSKIKRQLERDGELDEGETSDSDEEPTDTDDRHVCDECMDSFDSEKGLKIHKGHTGH